MRRMRIVSVSIGYVFGVTAGVVSSLYGDP
jgi:hypothetical protein